MNKNSGLIIPEILEEHYILGGTSKIKGDVINPSADWKSYAPKEESQNKMNVDTNGCVSFTTTNCIETLERFLKANKPNYSDRALFIASDTSPQGNDPHEVAETIRKKLGLVPEELLPFSDDLDSWEKYNSPKPLPKNIYDEGQKWWDKWMFRHEWVWGNFATQEQKREALKEALTKGTVGISVYAWFENEGLYYDMGFRHGHFTQLIGYKEGEYWEVFDSYEPHYKKLAWNYNFGIAKIFYLKDAEPTLSLLQQILNLIGQMLNLQTKVIEKKKESESGLTELKPELPQSTPELPKYKWDTKEEARRSVRVICDEMGLNWDQKNLITAVIRAESGFNRNAVNRNLNGSSDHGICQINDGPPNSLVKWWIGKGRYFENVQEVYDYPEKSVRLMIEEYRKGNLKAWIAYKSGAYKRHLQGRVLGGKNMNKIISLLESSDGTGRLSSRVSSFLVGLIPAIILIGKIFGYDILQTELQAGTDLFVQVIVYVEGLIGLLWHINAWAARNFRKQNKLGAFSTSEL